MLLAAYLRNICFAWLHDRPPVIGSAAVEVRYVGETSEFLRRMGQFGNSAGFWGQRRNGHSGGWRWLAGQSDNLWVGFFPIGKALLPPPAK
jgi:hypothetical protein